MSGRVLAQRERLLRSGLQLLGDPDGAAELVVLCLLAALRSPLLLRFSDDEAGDEALSRWLERMLVQRILQRLREAVPLRRGVAESSASASSEEPPKEQAAVRGRPGELVLLQRTGQALAALPPLSRIAVVLVVMQRRAPAEAAELLGCSEDTCRFWLGHGRKLLRRSLQRDLLPSDEGDQEARPQSVVTVPEAFHELRRNKKAIARA